MKSPFRRKLRCLMLSFSLKVGLWLLLGSLPVLLPAGEKWEPIAPEDLAATECKAYPGSSAEVLFERKVMDYDPARDLQFAQIYRRIKIYSTKGADEAGVLTVDSEADQKLWDIEARVTKANGISTEFTKKDFTESFFAKVGEKRSRRRTLLIPGLSPGDVVEMKWTETVITERNSYDYWIYQADLPIRRYSFFLKQARYSSRMISFNEPPQSAKSKKEKLALLDLQDIPPFVVEPYMPPVRDVRGWFLLFYTRGELLRWYGKKNEIWKEFSMELEEDYRRLTAPNSLLKAKAAELLKGMTAPEEKLVRLYDFCQENISNLDYFTSVELKVSKKNLDEKIHEQTPVQTLDRRAGYGHHINELFAALARAAGFKLRYARSSNRFFMFNVRHDNGWLFVDEMLVAVQVGEAWRYFSPGDYFVPAGMLDNAYEAAQSLICDPAKVILEVNPVSLAARSPVRRKGRFALDAEGNLEGTVEISMEGHAGITKKKAWHAVQRAEIDAEYRASITRRLPSAEVSALEWENLKGNKLPLIVRYTIKVPAYADQVGSKLIFSPNFFEHGAGAVFTAETRKHPIFFDYAWSERDDIVITLPEGQEIEGGNVPVDVGANTGALWAAYAMGYKSATRELFYKRNFALGGNGVILFQAEQYSMLKRGFDAIKRSDEHAVVLKSLSAVGSPPVSLTPTTASP